MYLLVRLVFVNKNKKVNSYYETTVEKNIKCNNTKWEENKEKQANWVNKEQKKITPIK